MDDEIKRDDLWPVANIVAIRLNADQQKLLRSDKWELFESVKFVSIPRKYEMIEMLDGNTNWKFHVERVLHSGILDTWAPISIILEVVVTEPRDWAKQVREELAT